MYPAQRLRQARRDLHCAALDVAAIFPRIQGAASDHSEASFSVYTDRTITCLDCGQEFSFTAGEQEFYAQRGFSEPPKRCPSCRAIRKAQRSRVSSSFEGGSDPGRWAAPAYDGYSSAYAGAPAGYDGGSRERRPRELFEAVCADCGKTASVPFRPSGNKPVYCSDCFQNHR